jgi:ribosomal protein L37AE/L43A
MTRLAENSRSKRTFGRSVRASKLTSRHDCNCRDQKTRKFGSGVWSCIPVSNLVQLRAATTAELAHRTRIGYQDFPKQQPERGRL